MNLLRKLQGVFFLALAAMAIWYPMHMQKPSVAHEKIIVATDKVKDGVFDKTVILVLYHNGKGAVGLALNHINPKKPVPREGGPVHMDQVFTLHTPEVAADNTFTMENIGLDMTDGQSFVDKFSKPEDTPKQYMTYIGHVGWGKGQLNREIDNGLWKIIDFDRDLVFKTKPEEMWKIASQRPDAKPEKYKKSGK